MSNQVTTSAAAMGALEPCHECGAALAGDQRYCLSCGARRAGLAEPLLAIAPEPVAAVGEPLPAAEPRVTRISANAAMIGGVGVLLLAMGVGVLIGQSGDDGPGTALPRVITVGAPAAQAATTPAPTTTEPAPTAHRDKTATTGHEPATEGSGKSSSAVQELDKAKTPQEFQKKSQKLPKVVGTGGKPPPKDNKPAAGGGSFEEIG